MATAARTRKRGGARDQRPEPVAPATAEARDTSEARWIAAAGGVAVLLAVGAVYVATAARDIVVGDTPDFITVAATLGVAHAPGYPLFTILGHLATLITIDPLPFRVNLLAALCGTGAAVFVYLT